MDLAARTAAKRLWGAMGTYPRTWGQDILAGFRFVNHAGIGITGLGYEKTSH